ncbi:hypothetical protein NGM99_13410 [Mesorhizobium sp. RP14(2022)]|uniref:Uncharacterized protein n=1 Tax=Mesorhizobium liriopis TaxID=2953882 RepID=A0ABT1C7H1_9HYPH|nr:hypothetical protein [Mesorhizobium liriopis]MCO6050777.1 hypothetical protein [Mesorhizobium liriopis]
MANALDRTTFVGKTRAERIDLVSDANLFWLLWGFGLPALIAAGAYTAVRLHERSLKR